MPVVLGVRGMASDTNDLEQQLRQNLQLRRSLGPRPPRRRQQSERGGEVEDCQAWRAEAPAHPYTAMILKSFGDN
jgi:hypothetical protein